MFRKLGEYTPDVLLLAKADRLSAQGPDVTREMTENNLNMLNKYNQVSAASGRTSQQIIPTSYASNIFNPYIKSINITF